MAKFRDKIFVFFVVTIVYTFSFHSVEANSLKLGDAKHIEDTIKQENIQTSSTLSKRQQKRLDKLMRKYNIDTVVYSKEYYDSLKVADPFRYVVDYMAKDKDTFNEIDLDSLSRSFFTDTLVVSDGMVSEFNSAQAISNVVKLDSMITTKMLIDKKMQRIMGTKKDTLSLTATTLISAVLPGFAQIKNKDYWKLSILYGGMGGFIGLGVMTNNKFNSAKNAYNQSIINNLPQEDINALHRKYNSVKNERLLYFAGAAATYLYFLADGIYNFQGKARAPAKASLLGVFIPGGGQIYNKSYWKLPIYYGGLAALGYIVSYNTNGYNRYNNAYKLVADDNPDTKDEFNGQYSADQLMDIRNNFRRARDMSILYTCGFYLLGIIDAYVDASFKSYDISDDLAFKITPTIRQINAPFAISGDILNNTMIGVSVDFKLNNR